MTIGKDFKKYTKEFYDLKIDVAYHVIDAIARVSYFAPLRRQGNTV